MELEFKLYCALTSRPEHVHDDSQLCDYIYGASTRSLSSNGKR